MARQFVIQLENRPGELAHLTRALAARGIDIRNIASVSAGPLASAFITSPTTARRARSCAASATRSSRAT